MPLDVLGRTRATLKHSTSPPRPTGLGNLLKLLRDGDRLLQLLIFNEEFLVSACHQRALITSLPFVHTARRSYRLNDPVRPPDWGDAFGSPDATLREAVQTLLFRGRRSRNKVSVGEPAEGSLPVSIPNPVRTGPCSSLLGVGAVGRLVDGLCVPPPAPGVGWWRVGMRRRAWHSSVPRARRSGACRRLCGVGGSAPPHRARESISRARTLTNLTTTPVEGYLGSRNDEERSEMRYVM